MSDSSSSAFEVVDAPTSPVASDAAPNNDVSSPVVEDPKAVSGEVPSNMTAAVDDIVGETESKSSDTPVAATTPASPTPVTPAPSKPSTAASSSSGFDLPAAGKAVVSAVDSVGAHVSWEDPVYTGFLLLSFVLFYAVFIWMQVSFPVFVLYATLFGFLASGAAKLAKDKFQKSVPMLPLPAPDADRISRHTAFLSSTVEHTLSATQCVYVRTRSLMTWDDWYASTRALAVVYLLTRNTWLFSLCTLFFVVVAVFSVPAAYNMHKAKVDPILQGKVAPVLATVGTHAATARSALTFPIALGVFGLGYALFWFMNWTTLTCWLTNSAVVFLAVDALPSLRPKTE